MHTMRRWLDPYVLGELNERQVERFESHVSRCADCRVELEQRRRRATRTARFTSALPVVSARTGEYDAGASGTTYAVAVGADTGPHDTVGFSARTAPAPGRRGARRERIPMVAFIAVCGVLAVLLSTAWVLGGAGPSSPAGAPITENWDEEGEQLSHQAVADLRREGWNLPALNSIGYELSSAVGSTVDGVPRVTLTYDGHAGAVVLREQRKDRGSRVAELPAPLAAVESPGAKDAAVGELGPAGALSTTVNANAAEPSLIDTADAVYEVTFSDEEPDRETVLNRILLTENALLEHAPTRPDNAIARLAKGLARMGVLEGAE
ncbi:hypothetical protein BJH93_15700 [Kocuria polaris]|nr:hypothetical protein [Kocuria polaris]